MAIGAFRSTLSPFRYLRAPKTFNETVKKLKAAEKMKAQALTVNQLFKQCDEKLMFGNAKDALKCLALVKKLPLTEAEMNEYQSFLSIVEKTLKGENSF